MHVKTFTGSTTTAVLAKIKADFGPDAVILETREEKGAGAARVVITAAVERDAAGNIPAPGSASGRASGPASGRGLSRDDTASLSRHMAGIGMGTGRMTWQDEWAAIKGHLLALMKPELQLARLSPRQRVAVEYLEREGVDATALLTLFEALLPDPQASILAPLASLVPIRAWNARNWPQKVHLIAGPFGAGKTTVLVRLALLLRKTDPGLKVWIVNADWRRGGGRMVLKNYAQLCGLEYREAGNAVEFANILAAARNEGADRILVDVPGLPRGETMTRLRDGLGMMDPAHALHLVLSPHFGDAAMRSLVERYVPADAPGSPGSSGASLIWTKLDEAEKFGTVINMGAAFGMPVSALSCGAELNDTLVPAEDVALWRLLFKQEMPFKANPDSGF